MREIDLIPADYLAQRALRRRLQHAAGALMLLLLAVAVARGWLAYELAREQPAVAQLQVQVRQAGDERSELLALQERAAQARQRAALLARLRAGAPWPQAVAALDAAVSSRVWLDQLEVVAPLPAPSPATSPTPSAAPASAPSAQPPAPGQLTLQGHALDHAALTDLVHALDHQAGVSAVRLTRSGLRRYATQDVVDFELHAQITTSPETMP